MKFRRRRRNEVSIELTPLIDVVFLLLIFFMVSTTFIRETQLELELPEASGELQQPEEQSIVITIAQDGTYAVNDQALVNNQLATLMRALRQQIGEGDALDADGRVLVVEIGENYVIFETEGVDIKRNQ